MKTYPIIRLGVLAALVLSTTAIPAFSQDGRPPGPPPRPEPGHQKERPEAIRSERIRERIRDLHAAGKHDEARQLAERVRNARMNHSSRPGMPGRDAKPAPKRDAPPHPVEAPPVMKIRNLKQAAGLLDAAGYREYAAKAREEGGRIEVEMKRVEEARKRAAEQRKMEDTKHRDAESKKAAEMKLRAEEKRRADEAREMREEMNKLRREVEELRGQLRKAKEEGAKRDQPERRREN